MRDDPATRRRQSNWLLAVILVGASLLVLGGVVTAVALHLEIPDQAIPNDRG